MEDTTNTTPQDGAEVEVNTDTGTEKGEVEAQLKRKSFYEEVAEITGLQLKDDETAKKHIKELTSYTGKQKEQKLSEAQKALMDSGEFITKSQYETDMFFSKNEQYQRDRELIEALSVKYGKRPQEVVELDTYKTIAEERTGYQKSKESENVLKSNPRITETRNTVDKSRTALKEGDYRGASDNAIKAVLENLGE